MIYQNGIMGLSLLCFTLIYYFCIRCFCTLKFCYNKSNNFTIIETNLISELFSFVRVILYRDSLNTEVLIYKIADCYWAVIFIKQGYKTRACSVLFYKQNMTVRKSRRILETKVHENILKEASMRMTEWMINIGSSIRSEKNHSRQENDQKGHLTLIAKLFLLLSRGCSFICVSLYACDNDWFAIT